MSEPEAHPTGTTLYMERRFGAPRDAVFAAWTDPEQVKQWFRPPNTTTPSAEMDVRVGGEYCFTVQSGDALIHLVGTYLEVEPPERLVYTFRWDPPTLDLMDTGETRVTVEFRDLGSETEVVLVHEKLRDVEVRDFHEFGWTNILDRMAELLASKPLGEAL
jgi:uncharacterized protein YndB with AHSA1/START domain